MGASVGTPLANEGSRLDTSRDPHREWTTGEYEPEGHETHLYDDVIELMSGTEYYFVLEVRPPGGIPYRIERNESVLRRDVRPGLSTEQKVPDGNRCRWRRA